MNSSACCHVLMKVRFKSSAPTVNTQGFNYIIDRHDSQIASVSRFSFSFTGYPSMKPSSGDSDGKGCICNAGDPGSIPGWGRSGERNGNPLHYSCLENPTDRGGLVGYSPWGRKNSDMAEQLTYMKQAFKLKYS